MKENKRNNSVALVMRDPLGEKHFFDSKSEAAWWMHKNVLAVDGATHTEIVAMITFILKTQTVWEWYRFETTRG